MTKITAIDPSSESATAMALALMARDTDRLRRVLEFHPGVWSAPLRVEGSRSYLRIQGPAAIAAINIDWLVALKILAKNGDDFTVAELASGHCALGYAVSMGNLPAVKSLIRLEACPNGVGASRAPISAIISPGIPASPVSKKIVEALINSGAKTSVDVLVKGVHLSLPLACLMAGQPAFAAQLLDACQNISDMSANEESILNAWSGCWDRGEISDHLKIQAALIRQKVDIPLELFINHLPLAKNSESYSTRQSERMVVVDLLKKQVSSLSRDALVDPSLLHKIYGERGLNEVRVELEARNLKRTTHYASMAASTRSPRL